MQSLAKRVKETIENSHLSCFSLYSGYIWTNGVPVRFPVGALEHKKHDTNGKTVYERYRYADNSVLEYCYDVKNDKATFTVKD